MTTENLNKLFKNTLLEIYPPEEINTFFLLCCEKYMKWNNVTIHSNPGREIPEEKIGIFRNVLERLKNEEPIQYILGETLFYGLNIKVNSSVLIPRPETEYLVDIILEYEKKSHLRILDIGTGSGCIALALAKSLKNALVWAMDISEDALDVAAENAKRNNIKNVRFIREDILSPVSQLNDLSVIVSNPPYVCYQEKKYMQKNILGYEPGQALFVNDNQPLIFYTAVLEYADMALQKGGRIYLEINEKYGKEIILLLKSKGYKTPQLLKDLQGKDRYVTGTKN
jgi:release factor glutamine methyltransferase